MTNLYQANIDAQAQLNAEADAQYPNGFFAEFYSTEADAMLAAKKAADALKPVVGPDEYELAAQRGEATF